VLLAALAPLAAGGSAPGGAQEGSAGAQPPNVVLILTDDQGWADLGCFGAEGIETPHIDRMAREGVRFTDFHVAQAVCSASRAALLTGCYSERVSVQGALGPGSRTGLSPDETTIAECLRSVGYATGMVGKWHLGHHPRFLPTEQGFDEWFGLPYSNDMWPVDEAGRPDPRSPYPPLHLLESVAGVEGARRVGEVATLADQARLTEQYTRRALDFIDRSHGRPFFLYLAHSLPHVPLGAPLARAGESAAGPYGDVIQEIDASVGRILDRLDEHGVGDDTLVVFTSDNGPWRVYGNHAGSAGPLREGKMTSWEGGHRVPCVMRWPARMPAGVECASLAATIDLLPTLCDLAGAPRPGARIDGVSLTALIDEPGAPSPRTSLACYLGGELQGLRTERWRLTFPHTHIAYGPSGSRDGGYRTPYEQREAAFALYDLDADVGETVDVAAEHPDVVAELEALAAAVREDLGDRLRGVEPTGARAPGRLPASRDLARPHRGVGASVELSVEPRAAYRADGAATLVDGALGTADFKDGRWLGFRESVDITVDLGAAARVSRVGASFLRSQYAWVVLPPRVELSVSSDGARYVTLGAFDSSLAPDPAQGPREYALEFTPRVVRFVRVRAECVDPLPDWHPGAGEPGWLFVDEVTID